MNEQLLQFIWRHRYFNQYELQTITGNSLRIVYPGMLNTNQGPDFLDAKIWIDQLMLAGSVELHLRASDWLRHKHNGDVRYGNVVLHVVWEYDGVDIPHVQVLELKNRISQTMLSTYHRLMISEKKLPCESLLTGVQEIIWTSWKERLLAGRMEYRLHEIRQRIERCRGNREEAFWQTLVRSWGMPLNADLFESVASSLPVLILTRHRLQIHQLEALLFGQAGLLNEDFTDPYPLMLQKEYLFLKQKYRLSNVNGNIQFLRMRPPEFPTIRLAQLAMLIHQSGFIFASLKDINTLKNCAELFQVTANDFWHRHYTFRQESAYMPKHPGKDIINRVIINAVIPFLYLVAKEEKNETLRQRMISWLFELPPERNKWMRDWERAGIGSRHAFDSQALLELRKNYCELKRCLDCAVGNAVMQVSHV